jgi:hypothetical protein
MEIVVIGAIRVLSSLPVLRWAFVGGLMAVFVDLSDLLWMNLLDLGGLGNYQRFDKYSDQVYMVAFLIVAWRWQGVAKQVALALFGYRLVGFVAFEATGDRNLLLFFPNVFEFWFLFIVSLPHWYPRFRGEDFCFTPRNVVLWLSFLTVIKLVQEFVLHEGQWLDEITFVEALEAAWEALRSPF